MWQAIAAQHRTKVRFIEAERFRGEAGAPHRAARGDRTASLKRFPDMAYGLSLCNL
jgi:hypothetical protein